MATWFSKASVGRMMKWSNGIWQRPNLAAKADIRKAIIADNLDCPVCRGFVSACCPSCNGTWDPEDLARWREANGHPASRSVVVVPPGVDAIPVPAPLPFPAPHDSPDGLRVALADLRGDLGDMRATLDGLTGRAMGMKVKGPTAAAMRQAADDLFNLSDVAAEAARAIHDAFPAQVTQ